MIGKRKRISPFYLGYIIFCGILLLMIIVGTIWFYDFIAAYEMMLPDSVVEAYIDELDEETLSRLIAVAMERRASGFEANDAPREIASELLLPGRPAYAPCAGVYTDTAPVYDIYCDGARIIKLTLIETDGGKYGMRKFTASSADVYDEWLDDGLHTLSVTIPQSAALMLNGKAVTGEYLSGTMHSSLAVSEFERGTDFGFLLTEYIIENVYGDAVISASYDSRELALEERGEYVYYSDYTFTLEGIYMITAPSEASIRINDVAVSDKYIVSRDGKASIVSEFEAESAPSLTVYEITGLMFEPVVTAELYGSVLAPTSRDESGCAYDYPDSSRKSCTVRIPHGEMLYCNGVAVGTSYMTGGGTYEAPASAKGFASASERYDEYSVTGLYNEPIFTLSDTLSVSEQDGDALIFYPAPDSVTEAELRAAAQLFTELFVKYSYEGTQYTKANYDAVIAHVAVGSDAYKIISITYDSMIYNSNFKVDMLKTEIYDMICYSGELYAVKVDFDSHGKYYKHEKTAAGTYDMLWQRTADGWTLIGFTL